MILSGGLRGCSVILRSAERASRRTTATGGAVHPSRLACREHLRMTGLAWVPSGAAAVKASFAGGAGPFARCRLDLGAVLGAELREPLIELGIALAGGLGDKVPPQAFDLVHRHPQSAHPHAGKAVLRDRRVLPCRLAQQRDRRGLVLRRAGAVE